MMFQFQNLRKIRHAKVVFAILGVVIAAPSMARAQNEPQKSVTAHPGYEYGSRELARSPITVEELDLLKKTVLFGAEDEKYLRMAGEVLKDQTDAVLDTWYGFVGGNPHLVKYFNGADGKPDGAYLAAVRKRFGKWIIDSCEKPYDQAWLDYQYEIALRHHRTKKNETDRIESVDNISSRYIVAFVYPITATIKPFLAAKGHSADDVDKMYQAWFKSVVLQVTLWTYPYTKTGDY
jgi:Protoglobin